MGHRSCWWLWKSQSMFSQPPIPAERQTWFRCPLYFRNNFHFCVHESWWCKWCKGRNHWGVLLSLPQKDAQLKYFSSCYVWKQELCYNSSGILGQLLWLLGKEISAGYKEWAQGCGVLILAADRRCRQDQSHWGSRFSCLTFHDCKYFVMYNNGLKPVFSYQDERERNHFNWVIHTASGP